MRRRPGGAIGSAPSNGSPEACASRCRTVDPGGPAGSSRSRTPSSAATSDASAATGFETDARRTLRAVSPWVSALPVGQDDAGCRERHGPALDLAKRPHAGQYCRVMERRQHLGPLAVRGDHGLLPRGRRRQPRPRGRDGADHKGRVAAAAGRVRADQALPRHRARGARARRLGAGARGPHARLHHRPRALRGLLPRARRGLPRRPPGQHDGHRVAPRPELDARARRRRGHPGR